MPDPNMPVVDPASLNDQGGDPYSQFVSQSASSSGEENPYAQFVKTPTTLEDIKKTAIPGAIRTAAAITALPSTLAQAAGHGVGYLTGSDAAKKFGQTMVDPDTGQELPAPSYGNIMSGIEQGKSLYQPQTFGGRVFEKAEGIAPFVAAGPGGWLAKLLMTAGASGGSEGLKTAAKNAGYGTGVQTAADLAGGLIGGVTPAVASAKLFSAIPEARQAAASLLSNDLGVDLNASRTTGRGFLEQKQANLGSPATESNELNQFSSGVANKAGIEATPDGRITADAIKAAKDKISSQYENMIGKAEIIGPNFSKLVTDVLPAIRKNAFKTLGDADIGPVDAMIDKIRLGAQGSPNNGSILGQRYLELRGQLQAGIDSATSPTVKNALAEMRSSLDDAMENSLPNGSAKDLHRLNSNFETVSNAKLEGEKITPKGLHSAITNKMGEGAFNRDRGLTPYAKAGEQVLTPLPSKTAPSGLLSNLTASGIGLALGSKLGPTETGVGAIWGKEALEPTIGKLLYRNPITKSAYTNPLTQKILGAQGKIGMGDVPTVAALLSGKPITDITTSLSPLFNKVPMKDQSQSAPLVRR